MDDARLLTLNDGRQVPRLGLGVWQTPADQTAMAVTTAIDVGYRSIDTAAAYRNEAGVGEGVRASDVAREDVFVTTKLWNDFHGFDATLNAFEGSLKRLGFDYLDLYLIHWPAPRQNLFLESWKAMIRLQGEGRVKSIGVSNFGAEHLDRLIGETGVAPVMNQVELHPAFSQSALRAANAERGVVTESWSPLGRGNLLENPTLVEIGRKHGKTAAQVIIRWHIALGLVVIPKSVTPARIEANFDVWDFDLDEADMTAIAAIDSQGGRMGPDPAAFG
ncbi:MAG TPA: aldo/keto reductase [Caulobacteraceae bacterium]